jgi:hypothetical protein
MQDLLLDYPLSDFIRQMAAAEAAKVPRSPRACFSRPRQTRIANPNPNQNQAGKDSLTRVVREGDENFPRLMVELPALGRKGPDFSKSGSPNVPNGTSPGMKQLSKSASVRKAQLDVKSFKLSLKQREEEFTPEPWADVYGTRTERSDEFNGLDWDLGDGMEGVREKPVLEGDKKGARARGRKCASDWNRGSRSNSRISHVEPVEKRQSGVMVTSNRQSRTSSLVVGRELRMSESTLPRHSSVRTSEVVVFECESEPSSCKRKARVGEQRSFKESTETPKGLFGSVSGSAENGPHFAELSPGARKMEEALRTIGEEEERPESSSMLVVRPSANSAPGDTTEMIPEPHRQSGVPHSSNGRASVEHGARPKSSQAEERVATARLLADLLTRRAGFQEPLSLPLARGGRPLSTVPGDRTVPPVLRRVLSAHSLRTLTQDLATVKVVVTKSQSPRRPDSRGRRGDRLPPILAKSKIEKDAFLRPGLKRPGTALAGSPLEPWVGVKPRPSTALERRHVPITEDLGGMDGVTESSDCSVTGGQNRTGESHGHENLITGEANRGPEESRPQGDIRGQVTTVKEHGSGVVLNSTRSEAAHQIPLETGISAELPLQPVPEDRKPKFAVPLLDLRAHSTRHVASPRSRSARAATTRESRLQHTGLRRSRSFTMCHVSSPSTAERIRSFFEKEIESAHQKTSSSSSPARSTPRGLKSFRATTPSRNPAPRARHNPPRNARALSSMDRPVSSFSPRTHKAELRRSRSFSLTIPKTSETPAPTSPRNLPAELQRREQPESSKLGLADRATRKLSPQNDEHVSQRGRQKGDRSSENDSKQRPDESPTSTSLTGKAPPAVERIQMSQTSSNKSRLKSGAYRRSNTMATPRGAKALEAPPKRRPATHVPKSNRKVQLGSETTGR